MWDQQSQHLTPSEHYSVGITTCIARLQLEDIMLTLISNDMNFEKTIPQKLIIEIEELKVI